MIGKGWLTIGALSRATHIPPATLRTWERRYGVPKASRKPSGHRLYPLEVVDHLLAARRALARGHRAAEVLSLPRRALESWLSDPAPRAAERRASVPIAESVSAPPAARTANPDEELLRLASAMDGPGLTALFREQWASLGPARFLDECAAPFLLGLSEAKRAAALGARHEAFASALLGDLLRELRCTPEQVSSGPILASAALPGDREEMVLLMGSLIASTEGWRVLYLGPGVAAAELAALAEETSLNALLVSIPSRAPQAYAFALLLELRGKVPRRTQLWVLAPGKAISAQGVHAFQTFGELARQAGSAAGI